jgi:putative addiction module killer protein
LKKKLQHIETFAYLCGMERKIITFGNHFKSFIESVDDSVRRKIDYVLDMLKTLKRINSKFVKLIKDGVYELRVEWEGNIYRVFFIFDEGNIVVLFNGFQKKTKKTPQAEIEKALKIKEEYYEYKRKHDSKL